MKKWVVPAIILLSIIICSPAMAAPKIGLTASVGTVNFGSLAFTPSAEICYMVSDHFAFFARLDFAILTLGPRCYFTSGRLRPFIEISAGTPVTGLEFFLMGAGGLEWEFIPDAILSFQVGTYGRFVSGGIIEPFGAAFVGYRL